MKMLIYRKTVFILAIILMVGGFISEGLTLGERYSEKGKAFPKKITLLNEKDGVSVLLHLLKNWQSIESEILKYTGDDHYQAVKACVPKNLSMESLESIYEYRGPAKEETKLIYSISYNIESIYKVSISLSEPCHANRENLNSLSWVIAENREGFRVVSFMYEQE